MDPINDITKKVIRHKIVSRRSRKIRKLELPVEDDTKNSSLSNSENGLDINEKDFEDSTSNTNLNVQNNFITQFKVSLNETNNVYESEGEPNECNLKNVHLSDISESESDHSSTEYELTDSDNNNEDKQSDSEIENNDISTESPIRLAVKNWAIDCKVLYSHIDLLLKALKPFVPDLPLSHKSLLKVSPQEKLIVKKFDPDSVGDTSEFVYIGIAKQLQLIINASLHTGSILELQFSTDGLPLFKSSSIEFWPILGKVHNYQNIYKPFVIAIYCGSGKPKSATLFFREFVEELNGLLKDGIDINGIHFKITIVCFVCDRPARSFVKCIKGHTGYWSCERCEVKGCRVNNRTVFPGVDSNMRTDESFRNQSNPQHHTDISPLTAITPKLDMVNQFILDFMHLGCLGIMKKLLEYWTTSSKLMRVQIQNRYSKML